MRKPANLSKKSIGTSLLLYHSMHHLHNAIFSANINTLFDNSKQSPYLLHKRRRDCVVFLYFQYWCHAPVPVAYLWQVPVPMPL